MPYSDMTVQTFTDVLASKEPVPGGGGASALVGAIGTALASMVGNLTTGKKTYAAFEPDLKRILEQAEMLRGELLAEIEEDARCFEPLSQAYGIPKDDPQRAETLESALRVACSAPMEIMRTAARAIDLHAELVEKGSAIMQSDVGVGVLCCKTALQGASLNVFVNAKLMADKAYAQELCDEAESLLETYGQRADETYAAVLAKLR
ncbi:MAG: cyclodeaminase/cyclohydrolase family protein [Oscillospiraceae bacterium]|jgi:formiminotetrahydrofolate cyclodeaminase